MRGDPTTTTARTTTLLRAGPEGSTPSTTSNPTVGRGGGNLGEGTRSRTMTGGGIRPPSPPRPPRHQPRPPRWAWSSSSRNTPSGNRSFEESSSAAGARTTSATRIRRRRRRPVVGSMPPPRWRIHYSFPRGGTRSTFPPPTCGAYRPSRDVVRGDSCRRSQRPRRRCPRCRTSSTSGRGRCWTYPSTH